ncbi:MAG TPA: hypothetical protein VHI13_19090 [Candidatus Kapabacteria bacterium]|nr:hypothetical protein [Candidatus Kapabacteria bacterium]
MITLRTSTCVCLAMAAVLCMLFAACGDKGPAAKQSGGASGRDSVKAPADTTFRTNLPAGRFHLPTRHTPAPDFFITLPAGYTVKDLSHLPNDEYFFVRNDDPSLRDSTKITPGFMCFYVGVNPRTAIEKGMKYGEQPATLCNTPVIWRIWTEKLPDGAPYFQREIASHDIFATISPELGRAPLHLYVYVAGSDSTRVAELMRAAGTLALSP